LTDQDFTNVKYWMDLGVKALIGVVISIVGLDYRSVKNNLEDLQEHKHRLASELAIVKAELGWIKNSVNSIDNKLDKALKR